MGVRKNTMSTKNGTILSAEAEQKLLAPIDEYVGGIQQKINALRADGTDQVIALTNHMAITRENANYTKGEKAEIIARDKKELVAAKAIEEKNTGQINLLIADAVGYLDKHYENEYYTKVVSSCAAQKEAELARYSTEVEALTKQHEADLAPEYEGVIRCVAAVEAARTDAFLRDVFDQSAGTLNGTVAGREYRPKDENEKA